MYRLIFSCLHAIELFFILAHPLQRQLHPRSISDLNPLARRFLIGPQYRPDRPICLRKRELEFRAQNSEFALFWFDASIQWEAGLISFAIGGPEVELDAGFVELDGGVLLVDFLEEERGYYIWACLVVIVSKIGSVTWYP